MNGKRSSLRTGRWRLAGAIPAAGLVLAACGNSGGTTSVTSGGTLSPTATGFPVTVDNCGRRETFDKPPTRAVFSGVGIFNSTLVAAGGVNMIVFKFIDFTTGARIQETVIKLATYLHPELQIGVQQDGSISGDGESG